MAITWADVVALDAQLSAVPVAAQAAIIADTYAMLPPLRWGTKLDLGAKYLAAHTGAMVLRGGGLGTPGQIMGERLGDASRSYADAKPFRSQMPVTDLSATPWGVRFQLLLRALGPLVAVSGTMSVPQVSQFPGDAWDWRFRG
jgi:hypothetical protein